MKDLSKLTKDELLKHIQQLERQLAVSKPHQSITSSDPEVKELADAVRRLGKLKKVKNYQVVTALAKALKVRAEVKQPSKAAPKYKNPDDPVKTWSGKGRKPSWLELKIKKGAKLESFLIN